MIFYFSATGNCKYVAERIADATSDTITSITDCVKADSLNFDIKAGESIGFVMSVYHLGLPTVVVDFLERLKLSVSGNHYTYHVLTYGMASSRFAHKMLEDALTTRSLSLNAKFSVQMPDTWTPRFDLSNAADVEKKLEKAKVQTDAVVEHIKKKDIGDYDNRKFPFGALFYRKYKHGGNTNAFTVSSACIGCSLCARQCPVSAIEMRDKKPVWVKERCAQCLGCLHRCPVFAIQYGENTSKHGQYVNPNVKL